MAVYLEDFNLHKNIKTLWAYIATKVLPSCDKYFIYIEFLFIKFSFTYEQFVLVSLGYVCY